MQLPVGEAEAFYGIIDVLTGKMSTFSEDDMGLAVSYTHLDVYKRQVKWYKRQRLFQKEGHIHPHNMEFEFRLLLMFLYKCPQDPLDLL